MAKNNNKKDTRQGLKIIPILIICLIILLAILITIVLYSKNVRSLKTEETLYYVYSDEIKYHETSPERIGHVYHAYKGDVNPKAITKSTYYFTHVLVPDYYKDFSSGKTSIKSYFDKNKEAVDVYTAIKSFDEFEKLVNAILNIKPSDGKLVYESSRFDSDSIVVDGSGTLKVDLYIKYKNCDEFKVKMSMKDTSKYTTSAIGYRIED